MRDAKKIKSDFPILADGKLVYLDSASTSQKPKQVINAVADYYGKHNSNVNRGVYKLGEKSTELYEESRKAVADFIGADAEEIVFVKNTTEAINLVAYGWGAANVKKGDNIVVTRMEHHSNFVPWQQLANSVGAEFRIAELDGFELDMKHLESLIDKKTKIVAVTHVSNVLGAVNDVRRIARIAHKKGALVLVDAAQSVPHMKVDVHKLGCDFLAFSGHKMLGPMGVGVLFGRKELLCWMKPFMFGGGMIKKVGDNDTTFAEPPQKFEAGTPDVAAAVGLKAAVGYLEAIGMDNVEKHIKVLTDYTFSKLKVIEGVKIYGNDRGFGIVSFNIVGVHAHDVATILDSVGVAVRAGHHCCQPLMGALDVVATIRASFYLYNTQEDVDRLCYGIVKAKRVLSG